MFKFFIIICFVITSIIRLFLYLKERNVSKNNLLLINQHKERVDNLVKGYNKIKINEK